MSDEPRLLVYGANGYTGSLIAERLAARGVRAVLAGRRHAPVAALAERLRMPYRIVGLEDAAGLRETLAPIDTVLHCAGPFSSTARPMLSAAVETGTNYLDITGEVDVFEMALAHDGAAREAGVVVCPGVGFDVVPTDCLAATLAAALPGGQRLALAFESRSPLSPGTVRTSLEALAAGARTRIAGRLQRIPLGHRTREIDFGSGPRLAVSITWGDLVTAAVTTGIRNIDVFVPISPRALARLRRLAWIRPLLRLPGMTRLAGRFAASRASGPTEQERQSATTRLWGEICDSEGTCRVGRLRTANAYEVTVEAAIAIATAVGSGAHAPGFGTPSGLMGADFVTRLPGSSPIEITPD